MNDLLTTHSPSPHATWLAAHGLITREYQHPHSLNGDKRWICANRAMTRYACGDTEDEAERIYCEREGIEWWKLLAWDRAMGPDIGDVRVIPGSDWNW